jgi:hypothetical protein
MMNWMVSLCVRLDYQLDTGGSFERGILTFLRIFGNVIDRRFTLGRHLARVAVAVTLLLGTIEVIQIRVSGRVVESTRTLLGLI